MMNDTLAPRLVRDTNDDTIGGRISLVRDAVGLTVGQISAVCRCDRGDLGQLGKRSRRAES